MRIQRAESEGDSFMSRGLMRWLVGGDMVWFGRGGPLGFKSNV